MEKTEFEKVKANFEKLEKDKGAFVIDGYDPIIEILKLFNRAYKLYMQKYITKRSAPGVSTAAKYTSFGENGPYRNDKIFDIWENGVLDVMKNRKYEFIFDKKTNLRVGNEIRPGGGANLRKFMTDMLDGDSLYKAKSGYGDAGRGKQAELLDKYFGEADDKVAAAVEQVDMSPDVKDNKEIVAAIEKGSTKIKATKCNEAFSNDGKMAIYPIRNTFLVIKAKDKDGNEIQRSFFIQDEDDRYVYMQYSKAFGSFTPYLDASILGHANEFERGDLEVKKDRKILYFTKITKGDFQKLMLANGTIEVGSVSADGKKSIESEKISLIGSYWITKDENGKNVVFDAIEIGKEKGTDKTKRDKLNAQINKATGGLGIINLTRAQNDIIIKRAS
jgi:hypothetical protein